MSEYLLLMENAIRIIIIGDYNFAYHSHNATNKALQHVEKMLDQQIDFFWFSEHEFCEFDDETVQGFDGVLIAPGPFQKPFCPAACPLQRLVFFPCRLQSVPEAVHPLFPFYKSWQKTHWASSLFEKSA